MRETEKLRKSLAGNRKIIKIHFRNPHSTLLFSRQTEKNLEKYLILAPRPMSVGERVLRVFGLRKLCLVADSRDGFCVQDSIAA
jgi:hypothetical protein